MFEITDRLMDLLRRPKMPSLSPTITNRPGTETWVSFLSCPDFPFFRFKPRRASSISYQMSSALISSSPEETRDFLTEIEKSAVSEIDKIHPSQEINILGVSLGSVLAVRQAARLGNRVDNLVLVAPGADLPYNILNGIATRRQVHYARLREFDPEKDYPGYLNEFSPINYVPKIGSKTTVRVFSGKRDLFIPDGERLISALENQGKNVRVTRYNLGHVRTIAKAANSGWQTPLYSESIH